uniref:50S ribosomal protein L18 n=1 Tax=Laminaria solidungula TaxID=309363 RepID=A0A5B9RGI1_9PHAE|nr:50S ribosomal protein L18 [Laminaria solidungula]QEG58210.1 50S ribosomal protein L18 [Laminaria solidungula]
MGKREKKIIKGNNLKPRLAFFVQINIFMLKLLMIPVQRQL